MCIFGITFSMLTKFIKIQMYLHAHQQILNFTINFPIFQTALSSYIQIIPYPNCPPKILQIILQIKLDSKFGNRNQDKVSVKLLVVIYTMVQLLFILTFWTTWLLRGSHFHTNSRYAYWTLCNNKQKWSRYLCKQV